MKKLAYHLAILSLPATLAFAEPQMSTPQSSGDISKVLKFLTNSALFKGDGKFMTIKGLLPASYYSDANYWGSYVCEVYAPNQPGDKDKSCEVTDVPRCDENNCDATFTLNGDKSKGTNLQIERVDATYGTDIYDASTWQIALALAAKNNVGDQTNLLSLIENVNLRLARKDTRATGETFNYGGEKISNPEYAYSYRMLGQNYLEIDPLFKTEEYKHYIHFGGKDEDKKELEGKISWQDWKPITGEHAWAFFIGALQADHIRYTEIEKLGYVPYASTSIKNAMSTLYAMQHLQAENGGVYYSSGKEGNQGPVPAGEISTENNASALSGLRLFKEILLDTAKHDPQADKAKIAATINVLDIMIWGGKLPNGNQTIGLLDYFKKETWDKNEGVFYQGGRYPGGKYAPEKFVLNRPPAEPMAVDVSTWGTAVLGPALIDEWHGEGTSFRMWQSVKQWGGFCNGESPCAEDKPLMGVGFSDKDENQIMTAEWTAGAINMLRTLWNFYKPGAAGDKYITDEQRASLQADHDSMLKAVLKLRTDNYLGAGYPGAVPKDYFVKLPENQLAFLYASKRYNIPFGWYANPIPSTCSTSWLLMLHYDYNPFTLKGSYASIDWKKPDYDQNGNSGPWEKQAGLPEEVKIKVKKASQEGGVCININKTKGSEGWESLIKLKNEEDEVDVTFPAGTMAVGVTNVDESGNCQWGMCGFDANNLDDLYKKWKSNKGVVVEVIWNNNKVCNIIE